MGSYFYRVVPIYGETLPNPHTCQHSWSKVVKEPNLGDAYCAKCRHYGSLTEDTRNRPVDWWKEREEKDRAAYPDKEMRELE